MKENIITPSHIGNAILAETFYRIQRLRKHDGPEEEWLTWEQVSAQGEEYARSVVDVFREDFPDETWRLVEVVVAGTVIA